jgi:GTP cyclohydrolase I
VGNGEYAFSVPKSYQKRKVEMALVDYSNVLLEESLENEDQKTASQTSWLNQGDIEIAVNSILRNIGENPEREGLLNTPNRVARMYQELTEGYHIDPKKLINDAIFTVDYDEMVVVKDIDFYSMCEHHMLPFYGRAHVAYIPNGKVIGLSKIPRIVDMFARRLQIQEQMTSQIANFLQEQLQPQGVAVVVEGAHMCAMMRGVKKANTKMVTSKMLGCFRENEKTRAEFLSHIRNSTFDG